MVQITRTASIDKLIEKAKTTQTEQELVKSILKYTSISDKLLMQSLYEEFDISYTIRGI